MSGRSSDKYINYNVWLSHSEVNRSKLPSMLPKCNWTYPNNDFTAGTPFILIHAPLTLHLSCPK